MSTAKDTPLAPMDKEMHDALFDDLDKALDGLPIDAPEVTEQETGWFGKVKARVSKASSEVRGMLEGFVLYRVSKEVCANVAIEELERGTAKIIRSLFWKIYDKYSTAQEGSALYSFRHSDTKFWTSLRTAAVAAGFGVVAALFLRQAGIYRERGDEKSASLYEFIGRACIKAGFLEAGRAINVDAMIEGGLNYIVGFLPDIRKEVESAQEEITKNAAQAQQEGKRIQAVRKMPEHGSGKGMREAA